AVEAEAIRCGRANEIDEHGRAILIPDVSLVGRAARATVPRATPRYQPQKTSPFRRGGTTEGRHGEKCGAASERVRPAPRWPCRPRSCRSGAPNCSRTE